MNTESQVRDRIDGARLWALSNGATTAYGGLAMRLADVIDPACPTAATDGTSIRWGLSFCENLSDPELRFVLLHETLHCAHQHLWRLPCDSRGNVAGDHEINLLLQGIRGISMPAGCLRDQRFSGMAAEEILALLPEDAGTGGQAEAGGTFTAPAAAADDDQAGQAGTGGQTEAGGTDLRDQWQVAAAAAEFAAGAEPGDGSAGAVRDIAAAHMLGRVDWREELAGWIRQSAETTRADWARPCRRSSTASVIMPRRRPDSVGVLLVVRDTSGSVNAAMAAEFAGIALDAATGAGAGAVRLLDCDTALHDHGELHIGDAIPACIGGGGTDFRPPFALAQQLIDDGERVAGMVYLTDLECDRYPDAAPEFPVLWLTEKRTVRRWRDGVPFGRVVEY